MQQNISVSAKGIIVKNNKILLLEYCDDVGLHFNFPGGKLKPGINIKEGLKEKIYIETGLNVLVEKLLFVVEYVPDKWDYEFGEVQKLQFQFLCKLEEGEDYKTVLPLDANQTGVSWVDIQNIKEIHLLPQIQNQVYESLTYNKDFDALLDNW